MKRYCLLGVDRLEDRCVPAVDVTDAITTTTVVMEAPTEEPVVATVVEVPAEYTVVTETIVSTDNSTEITTTLVVIEPTTEEPVVAEEAPLDDSVVTETTIVEATDGTSFVIDVYLNDPSSEPTLPEKPVVEDPTEPIPDSYWTDPTEPVVPIDDPYWY